MNTDAIDAEHTALVVQEEAAMSPQWTPSFVRTVDDQIAMLAERDRFYRNVLKPDTHYGIIPGTQKPSLWKPGAEALLSAMALHAETGNESEPVVDVTGKDHDGEPFVQYIRWCRIYRQTGPQIQDRIEIAKLTGACNSWEPKYRYRDSQRVCPACGVPAIIKGKAEYGGGWVCFKKKNGCNAKFNDGDPTIEGQNQGKIANPDVLELQNTILKMADKRALIAATLVATGCSDIFTQDVEDMPATMGAPKPAAAPRPRPAVSQASVPDDSARLMGVSAIQRYCAKHGLVVPATEGKSVDDLRAIYEGLVASRKAAQAASAAPAQPQSQPEPKPAPEAKETPINALFPPASDGVAPSQAVMRRLFAILNDLGHKEKAERLGYAASFGLDLASYSELSQGQAMWLADRAQEELDGGRAAQAYECPACGTFEQANHRAGCPEA